MKQSHLRLVLVVVLLSAIGSFFYFDLGHYLSFDFLKNQRDSIHSLYQQNSALTIGSFFAIYVVVTALSLPGAAIMTLAGGAIFGLATGTIVVSFASTLGATLAFLVARFLLRDSIQRKFADRLKTINEGVEKEGLLYLFSMRLIPAIPFFVINLVMGLTPIRTVPFFLVSQIGMLPGTMVYVNAGTQLGELDSLAGILSPKLILSFVLLGIFPLIAKKLMGLLKKNRSPL